MILREVKERLLIINKKILLKILINLIIIINNIKFMNLQYSLYHIQKPLPAYCKIFDNQQADLIRQERYKLFQKKFKQIDQRKPFSLIQDMKKFMQNIYAYDLKQIKKILKDKYKQYDQNMIQSQIQVLYQQEIKKHEMIKGEDIIIQESDQPVENGRKLKKQVLTAEEYSPRKSSSRNSSISDKKIQGNQQAEEYNNLFEFEDKLNKELLLEINKQNNNFKQLRIILEDQPEDLINSQYSNLKFKKQYDRLHKSDPFIQLPSFKTEQIVRNQPLDTGRTDLQNLQNLIKQVVGQQPGFSSRRTSRNIKIKKQILDNLYDFQGRLKLDLIKKVIDRVKK